MAAMPAPNARSPSDHGKTCVTANAAYSQCGYPPLAYARSTHAAPGCHSSASAPRTIAATRSANKKEPPIPDGPFDDKRLALAELEAFAGALAAVFLRFFFARVAGEEAVLAQRFLEGFVHCDERARDAVPHGAGLSGHPAAFGLDRHVEAPAGRGGFQRLAHDLLVLRARKVLVERLGVHRDDALAQGQLDRKSVV